MAPTAPDNSRAPRSSAGVGVRRFAIWFLGIQGLGGLLWWVVLLDAPETRRPFLAPGAPESTLLAFLVADVSLFAGGSLAAAWGLARDREWAWTALSVHAGAATYAGLYCVSLPVISGGGWLAAGMMLPSLAVVPWLLLRLRPGAGR